MSEIVKVKSTGEVFTVVSAYIHSTNGAELLALQPIGRNQYRYLMREAVTPATQRDMAVEVAVALTRAITEIERTIAGSCDNQTRQTLTAIYAMLEGLAESGLTEAAQ